jgi:hypothetical protein
LIPLNFDGTISPQGGCGVPSGLVTVIVESSLGEDGPLTVEDGLGQVLDLFELLNIASAHFSQKVGWSLVSVSKQSPLTAIAEAFSTDGDAPLGDAARYVTYQVSEALSRITEGEPIPVWMGHNARSKTKSLFRRNLNGIGLTKMSFSEGGAHSIIVERSARLGLAVLEQLDAAATLVAPDFSHSALGSTEGVIEGLATYYGKASVRLREPLGGARVPCVLSDTLAKEVGNRRKWNEVWTGRRVRAVGKLFYKRDGSLGRVLASDFITVETGPPLDRESLPTLRDDIKPTDYLRSIWSDDDE